MVRTLAFFLCLAITLRAGAARAQPATDPEQQQARVHFERGLALLNQQNYDGALAEFQRSYELSHRVSVLYNLGVTYQALHRYAESARALEEYLRLADNLTPERRTQVEQALTQIRGFIAYVRIVVEPAGATVTVDGEAAGVAPLAQSVAVGPGRHTVEATARDREAARESFTIASGETREVRLVLAGRAAAVVPVSMTSPGGAAMAAIVVRAIPGDAVVEVDGRTVSAAGPVQVTPGSHQVVVRAPGSEPWRGDVEAGPGTTRTVNVRLVHSRTLGRGYFYAGLATTGALLAGGAIFGLLTRATHSDFSARFQDDPEAAALAERGIALRTATNVFLGAAALSGLATGVLFVLTRPFSPGHSTADVAFAPGPDGMSARLRVRF